MAYCTNCGTKLQDGKNFCVNCGAKVIDTDSEPAPRIHRGARTFKPIFAVVACVVLVGAGILVGIFFSMGSSVAGGGQQQARSGARYDPKSLGSVLYAFAYALHNGDKETVNALYPFRDVWQNSNLVDVYNELGAIPADRIGVYAYKHYQSYIHSDRGSIFYIIADKQIVNNEHWSEAKYPDNGFCADVGADAGVEFIKVDDDYRISDITPRPRWGSNIVYVKILSDFRLLAPDEKSEVIFEGTE
jgi:hypothetical protein